MKYICKSTDIVPEDIKNDPNFTIIFIDLLEEGSEKEHYTKLYNWKPND